MMPVGRPRFEVIAAASSTERRLIPLETIRDLTGVPETGEGAVNDTTLAMLLDGALASCAKSCRLATYRATPPTLALESVRATWLQDSWVWPGVSVPSYPVLGEPSQLLLPWRAPILSVEITENEIELVEDTDFRLLGAGVVERIGGWWPTSGAIVVDYIAGWVPLSTDPSYDYDGETMPADLVMLVADQVRMAADRTAIDLNLRSEDLPNIGSWSFNIPGGDAIDTGGLLRPLYDALEPYRAPPSIG